MTGLALVLVLVAAFAHAAWNFFAKKASGGVQFIWLFGGFSSIIYAPIATRIIFVDKPEIGWASICMILASAVVHSIYFTLLDLGYRIGDLSVVYPIARGTAPLISATVGILFLGERPSIIAVAGIVLMAVGIFIVSGFKMPRARGRSADTDSALPSDRETDAPVAATASFQDGKAVLVALACGAAIATYTVLDKVSVSILNTPPFVLDWGTNFGRFLLITPFALRDKGKIKEQWRLHKGHAAAVAVLSSLAYILVLFAMRFTPVSYIAPAREISILVGAAMGARFLAEENAKSRVIGTTAMVAGLVALALG